MVTDSKYVEGESNPYTELQLSEFTEVTEPPPVMPQYKAALMNATQFGLNFMVLLLGVIVVPAQVEKLVGGESKGRVLGGLVACGAVATFLVSPVVGMVSDRITSRLGRRRPVMLVGTALLCIGLLGMAITAPQIITPKSTKMCRLNATMLEARRCLPYTSDSSNTSRPAMSGAAVGHPHGVLLPRYGGPPAGEGQTVGSLPAYVLFFLLVISSQATISVSFNALVSDKSHPSQRGTISGVMGFMILLGNMSGAVAGTGFTHVGVLGMYAIIIVVNVACTAVTVLSVREVSRPGHRHKAQPLSCRVVFIGFWSPLREHDFRWVFITRFLMQQGVATITGFLQYWLHDMIPLPFCIASATAVALLVLPLLFSAGLSTIIGGVISDKTGHRKIIVTVAAFMIGLGSFINAFLSGEYAYYTAAVVACVIGLGFGAFLSVDFALLMDVLRDEAGKDIAVWHQALVLPQALATPLGGYVLDLFQKLNCRVGLGYMILFITTSLYAFLSGALVYKIRRVR